MCVRACACMVCGPVRVGEGGKRAAVAAVMANSAGWDRGMGRHFRLVAIDNAEDEDDVADEGVDDMERPHPSPPAIHTPDPALQVRRRLQCIPATIQRPATVGGAAPLLCIRPGSGFAAAATDVRIVCSRTFGQCGSREPSCTYHSRTTSELVYIGDTNGSTDRSRSEFAPRSGRTACGMRCEWHESAAAHSLLRTEGDFSGGAEEYRYGEVRVSAH